MSGKYKTKFATELKKGLRKDGKSEVECCLKWGVTRQSFWNWKKKYPKFAEAAEIGEMDAAAWWHKLNRDVSAGTKKGNAGLIAFALKNIEGIGWADKVEVNNHHDEQINVIRIEVLPTREQMQQLNTIDGELLE